MNQTNSREEWTNCIGNQQVSPLHIFRPTTLNEIVEIIRRAERENRRVRAVGSGHSFSDVALTDDFLIDTHGLKRVLALESETFKADERRDTLVETECGIRISDLNAKLDKKGLALKNAGGHTAQTIVGALSTSTHGSGIELGSIASFVKSIVIVGSEGKVYRIEPSGGITDPQEFKKRHGDVELRQDDDWFNAVVVGLGCMGVVYSVTLEVMHKYWLKETRTVSKWTQVKAELRKDVLRNNRHYEVLVNPYKFDGDHSCLITARETTSQPPHPSPEQDNRSPLSTLFSWLPRPLIRFSGRLEIFKLGLLPGQAPRTIENAIKALADEVYIAESYRVLDLGAPNYVAAYSSELALPVENGAYIAAADKIIEIAERNRTGKKIFHSLPFSLRFVASDDLYFSMMYRRTTCMIEVPMIDRTKGGLEILRDIEDALLEFEARPHWGQVHYLAGGREAIKQMYPMFDRWIAVRKALNPIGTFNNRFSERCGFDA